MLSAVFLQPAIQYEIPVVFQPRVALKLVNFGSIDDRNSEFRHPTELQAGFGITPTLPIGRLDILIDYKSLNYEESSFEEKLHIGALFRYGAMNLATGLDQNGASFGVFYGLEQINSGILFSTTQLPWKKEDYYAQTVYVQVGWQL